ncbi:MAG: phosphoenolpyruvate--protein phosphotransferase [Acidobacteria bacterium]|nr:phosphoenolpyruvate--protein phosphotransferase [Acidobacteriota bacterium]
MTERAYLKGICASPGIALGKAVVLETQGPAVFRVPIRDADVEREVARFRSAVAEAGGQLEKLQAKFAKEHRETAGKIFEAQILMVRDETLLGSTEERIRREKINAEWALHEETARLTSSFADLEDRERWVDNIEDVQDRLQKVLLGQSDHHNLSEMSEDVIVISTRLSPSETALLKSRRVIAFATDKGGQTSHTAIIAKALAIPAVVGLHDLSRRVQSGDLVVVDGSKGEVIVNPGVAEKNAYLGLRSDYIKGEEQRLRHSREAASVTLDGCEVLLNANIELPEQLSVALRHGARGIGLYRSEFLFLNRSPQLPSEEEHYQVYRALAEGCAPEVATIRTLDLGGEKYFHSVLDKDENNPVLGMRAIRFCLMRRDIFKTQLRGILRASRHGKIRVMFPLISGVEELRQAKEVLDEAREELAREGVAFDPAIPVGIMIEVPSAAAVADLLAREADFFSIGTNDLIQYTLAIDRSNESVSYLYRPLHPAILRTIRFTLEAAAGAGIPVSMCGEMAADPIAVPILLGLGLREFSMDAVSIPIVKAAVRSLSLKDARAMVGEIMTLATARDVEAYASSLIEPKLRAAVEAATGMRAG